MFVFTTIAKGNSIWVARLAKKESELLLKGIGLLTLKNNHLKIECVKNRLLCHKELPKLLEQIHQLFPSLHPYEMVVEVEIEIKDS